MPRISTKNRILNCAEQLFAREGFHSTSLRILTHKAGVNLAAVNYHFGSKEALLRAVIERRLVPLNKLRHARLEDVLQSAAENQQAPRAQDLLRAFIEPTLEFRDLSPGAEDFLTLISRSWNDPDPTVRNCFMELVLPMFKFFFASLQQALPDLPVGILRIRMQFLAGTMSIIMCRHNNFQEQPEDSAPPLSREQQLDQLLKFILAGLEAPQ